MRPIQQQDQLIQHIAADHDFQLFSLFVVNLNDFNSGQHAARQVPINQVRIVD